MGGFTRDEEPNGCPPPAFPIRPGMAWSAKQGARGQGWDFLYSYLDGEADMHHPGAHQTPIRTPAAVSRPFPSTRQTLGTPSSRGLVPPAIAEPRAITGAFRPRSVAVWSSEFHGPSRPDEPLFMQLIGPSSYPEAVHDMI